MVGPLREGGIASRGGQGRGGDRGAAQAGHDIAHQVAPGAQQVQKAQEAQQAQPGTSGATGNRHLAHHRLQPRPQRQAHSVVSSAHPVAEDSELLPQQVHFLASLSRP